jgi:hypothetical protein
MFPQGVVRLLEILHPRGTGVSIIKPQPDSGGTSPRYEWSYTLDYSLNPS